MYRSEGYLLIRVVIALAAANETAYPALQSYRDHQALGAQGRQEMALRVLAPRCLVREEVGVQWAVATPVA